MKLAGLATLGAHVEPFAGAPADYELRIGNARVEVAPGRVIATTAYNGQFPGPLLRFAVGRRASVDVFNDTGTAERVHWHGQDVPGDITGAPGEDAALVPARAMRRFEFTPVHSGLHFYHSQLIAGTNLETGLYGGQAGAVFVEPRREAGRFDREVVLVLKEFEPLMRRMQHGCEVGYRSFTINGRMLGHGEPVCVKPGERVLFHVLNASATALRSLALPGHTFSVVALDGNPVPWPAKVPALWIGAAERVSAVVEMNHPGVWILGDLCDADRHSGMGIVVEYAGCSGKPGWSKPAAASWDYTRFGPGTPPAPDETLEMVLATNSAARSGLNRWTINGMAFSTRQPSPMFQLQRARRYRLKILNASDDIHPVHLQRHRFELARIAGRPTAGISKDVVMVGARQQIEVDFVADHPGRTLFYCNRQLHRDFGLMARIDYA